MNTDFLQSDLSWLGNIDFECTEVEATVEVPDVLPVGQFDYEMRASYKLSDEAKNRIRSGQQARLIRERELGIVRSPSFETRQKISDALFGRKNSEESNEKRRISSSGYVHSEESKRKISMVHKGKKISDEARANMRAAQQLRKESGYVPPPVTDEIRAKIGAAHKGKFVSEETRAKLRAANLGKKKGPNSNETIERMKIAAVERWVVRKAKKAALEMVVLTPL